jgi:hypothetical protein
MTRKDLKELYNTMIEASRNIMFAKNVGYGDEDDALRNIKNISKMFPKLSNEEVLGVLLSKHLETLFNHDMSYEDAYEKICDSINYLILLQALKLDKENK